VVLFTVVLGQFYVNDRQKLLKSEVDGVVAALSTAVEREIAARFQVLTALADSSELARSDLEAFLRELHTYVHRADQGWFTMLLIDPDSQSMLLNTLRPFGAPLPYPKAPAHIAQVAETRRPQAFGVIPSGSLQPRPLVVVGVPVVRDGKVRYVLNGTFFPAVLNAVLAQQNFPAAHTVAIVDANGRIAARSREADTFVGSRITESAAAKLAAINGNRGHFKSTTQEGEQVWTTFQRIPSLGWTILYGVPETILTAPLERANRILLPAGLAAVLCSAGLTVLFARSDRRRHRRQAQARAEAEAEARRGYEALEQARDRAEAANQAKTDFLANMSHDLRTPLNAVLGFTEALQLEIFGPLANEKQRESLRSIHHAGSLLKGCIDEMLDMAQVESGWIPLNETTVDLGDMIRGVVARAAPLAASQNLHLEFTPAADAELPKIRADALRFAQALTNLLDNAVKFTPAGGLVTIDADLAPDGWVRIAVRDSGDGIDPRDMELIQLPFGRASSPYVKRQNGTGLGLPLARRLILLHGGTFQISSRAGIGTVVSIGIPPERVVTQA
jgi:two-component system cell cycle sensor histidine kinase PleC